MDVSVEYIEMCEKAQEIQEYYQKEHEVNISIGDIVYIKNIKSATHVTCIYEPWEGFWLPRQDQLQEIVSINWRDYSRDVLKDWYEFSLNFLPIISMEQLWLLYTMYKVYNKQWNPETKEWEKV